MTFEAKVLPLEILDAIRLGSTRKRRLALELVDKNEILKMKRRKKKKKKEEEEEKERKKDEGRKKGSVPPSGRTF